MYLNITTQVLDPQSNAWVSQKPITYKIQSIYQKDFEAIQDWLHNTPISSMSPQEKIKSILNDPFNEYYELRLGLACNNHCTHCFIADRTELEEKTTAEIYKIIDSVPRYWMLGITGGEPTIRKDFLDILEYSKRQQKLTYVQTHGRRFSDTQFALSAADNLDGALIAIHSHRPDVHDSICGAEGAFAETYQGIKNLVKDGRVFVATQTVIVRKNYKDLMSIAEMIQDIHPGCRMSFTFPHPTAGAYSVAVTPALQEIHPYVLALLKKWGYLIQTHYIPRCYMYPYHQDLFNVDMYSLGTGANRPGLDILEGKWREVDYGDKNDTSTVKLDSCRSCIFDNVCNGVWKEYAELYDLILPAILG